MSKESTASQSNTSTLPSPPKAKNLPPWKVLLHNDDVNDMAHVVASICMLTPLSKEEAFVRMLEAHTQNVALLLTTHQELAELYQEQLTSRGLCVTIEQDDE